MWLKNAVRNWRHRRRADAELDEEVRGYAEMLAEEKVRSGVETRRAQREAQMELGGVEQVKERTREARAGHFLETLWQDVRYGARQLRRSPAFTIVAVLTLALGIGANTAIFTLVNGILLQSLPYPDSDRLVTLFNGYFPKGFFVGVRDLDRSANLVSYSYDEDFNFLKNGEPIRLDGTPVSAGFFTVLGVNPELGRIFHPGEDTPGQNNVVVLSHKLWQQRFGADPNIIGHSIKLNDIDREVIGVMPATFRFPSSTTSLWVPLSLDPRNATSYWTYYSLQIVGRLRPGVTLSQSQAELLSLLPRLRAMFPYAMASKWGVDYPLVPLQDSLVAYVRTRLLLLLGGVGLVLLIACVNVANLLLARTAARQREIALRLVLGAGRWRLARQFVTEATVLALAAGVLGFAFAKWAVPLLRHSLPQDMPRLIDVSIGFRGLAFTAGLSILIGVIFGLLASFRVSRADVERTLCANAPGAGMTRARHKLSSALLIGEVATAVIVVICAGLLAKSLWKLSRVNPGFRTDHLVTELITPTAAFCSVPDRCLNFYNQVVNRARSVPGIEDAAIVNVLPLSGKVNIQAVTMEGHPVIRGSQIPLAWENAITPDYLNTMGIQLISGRNFTAADTATSARVVLVNASMARHFWPGQNPVGKHVYLETTTTQACTIVGIVNDVREFWLQGDPNWFVGELYLPYAQTLALPHTPDMTLVMRTEAATSTVTSSVRQVVASVDPDVPISDEQTIGNIISTNISAPTSTTWLFAIFALLALVLSMIGVYGVISYSVAQQTHEIGVRMALGAQHRNILRLVLGHGGKMALIGIAIGLAAATVLTRLMKTMLFGVSTIDPLTFAGVSILLILVALLACYIPARRAMKVDPMTALRYE